MLYPNGDIYHGTYITLDLYVYLKKKKKKKKKKSKAYLPILFFSGKEPETQLLFFWPYKPMGIFSDFQGQLTPQSVVQSG